MSSEKDNYLELLKKFPQLLYKHQTGGLELKVDLESRIQAEAVASNKINESTNSLDSTKTGIVAEDEYLLWLRDAVVFPNNKLGTYIRLFEKPLEKCGVAVLPIFQNKILLIRHFRHASGKWHWEIPRGYCDAHETVFDTASRELEEEIGADVAELKELGQYHPNTGLLGNAITILQANVNSYGVVDKAECISELIEVTTKTFKDMVKSGDITDGFTLSAFTYYQCSL